MTAPDHRGETERWTLHWNPIMSNSLGVPTDCYWQGVYHNPDCPLPKHIEVVPAIALAAERERADRAETLLAKIRRKSKARRTQERWNERQKDGV